MAHRENEEPIEINALIVRIETLEIDLNERGNEVIDLDVKVEALELIVKEIDERVNNITTPSKKEQKKRRRISRLPKGELTYP